MYNKEQKIHFVGVAGVGMAGIAEILARMDYSVTGSDKSSGPRVDYLVQLGVQVYGEHSEDNVDETVGVLVYSSAVPQDNPELVKAKELGIPVIRRAEMLAELLRMKYGIAVAGSHGKTSTTSLIAHLLVTGELDPSVIIGGRLIHSRSGAKLGKSQFMVAEADESDGSFSLLRPTLSVITNIDYEHIEHYGSFEVLESSFRSFLDSVPFYGAVFACFECERVRTVAGSLNRRVVSYGFSQDLDFSAKILRKKTGLVEFELFIRGESQGEVKLPISGDHQVLNSLAAIAVASELKVSTSTIKTALESFPGVARRSELLFESGEVSLYDDYGHHPTEIAATLSGLSSSRGSGRLVVIFQPHRFSRTRSLFQEFEKCFDTADLVLLTDIYSAGEEDTQEVSSESLVELINKRTPGKAIVVKDFNGVIDWCESGLKTGDTLITMGAGSIGGFAPRLKATLQRIFKL